MTDIEFRIFMDLLMVSDPWPLVSGKDEMDELADKEAMRRGFDDWIDAYHRHEPKEFVS